jgi:hypothetical protein
MMSAMTDTPSVPDLRTVEITSLGTGGRVVLEGYDVTSLLTGVDVHVDACQAAQVTLHASALRGLSYSGPALVTLVSQQDPPTGDPAAVAALVADWLSGIDATDLEARALTRLVGMGGSPIAAALAVLTDTARQAAGG